MNYFGYLTVELIKMKIFAFAGLTTVFLIVKSST